LLKVLAVANRPELWFGVTSPVEIHEADLLRWDCVVEAAKRIFTGKVADKTDAKKASEAFSKLAKGEE
jgi:hypothetical protein